ncbi:MAG: ABC transporter ATP-binding protein [Rhodospirillaceae bacterium]|nr:ABC transporter ATP-binding protein [Rhodospirillaceae bacterium]
MTKALETVGLAKSFGALQVTRDVHLSLEAGARHALIGPNGAGKTTLVNLMSGALAPDQGQVLLSGADVTGLSQARRVKQGLARTYQINQLFRDLTVLENVVISVSERLGASWNLRRRASARAEVIDEAVVILGQLQLDDHALTPVRELPYGRQRLVEIAMTLAQRPAVLLLDEPAAGVPSAESHIILDVIAGLPDHIAVLIIEHDMDIVFRFAQAITVLVAGGILAEGTPDQIAADERVRAVYLGQGGDV